MGNHLTQTMEIGFHQLTLCSRHVNLCPRCYPYSEMHLYLARASVNTLILVTGIY